MTKLFLRFTVIAALMFWQGGFTFYASVVVPIGQATLGHLQQGLITRQVTNYLNIAAVVALLPLAWDVASTRAQASRRRLRWLTWLGMAVMLGLLVWLHGRLDDLLDVEAVRVLDRGLFRPQHRAYLWLSTMQWVLGILYLLLTLQSWREEDTVTADPPHA
jgi:hypothetical protein